MKGIEYQPLIQSSASTYEVDPVWIESIISVESSWNRWASRFESGYQWLFLPDVFSKNVRCTLATEIALQKTSFGLGQIMGALAREQGHIGDLAEMYDPSVNIPHIAIRLSDLSRISSEKKYDTDSIFAGYNGGPQAMKKIGGTYSNQVYVDKVKLAMKKK